jgi:hypothetical protein
MDPHALSDADFLAGFEACALPPAAFDHRGHLRLAWLRLQAAPLAEAVPAVCEGIRRFAAHLGVPEKYNHTLTEALVRLMARGGAQEPTVGFADFLAANPALVRDARGLLARHYSAARLESAAARERFLAPDLAPLDE